MKKPTLAIHYCPGCKWLTRSTWMAQELLDTFATELEAVSLYPSGQSGVFKIEVDGTLIWDRVEDEGFPQIKELKRRVRDRIAPQKSLGHLDR